MYLHRHWGRTLGSTNSSSEPASQLHREYLFLHPLCPQGIKDGSQYFGLVNLLSDPISPSHRVIGMRPWERCRAS